MKPYYVYIMTNAGRTVLYTGVTGDLGGRIYEHRNGIGSGFAYRYRVTRLVYVETFEDPFEAIRREKQIKKRSRKFKRSLIESTNPNWEDLMPQEKRPAKNLGVNRV